MENYNKKSSVPGTTRYFKLEKYSKTHHNLPLQVARPAKYEAAWQTELVPIVTATTPEAANMALQSPQTLFVTSNATNADDDVISNSNHVTDPQPSCSGGQPLQDVVLKMFANESHSDTDTDEREQQIETRVFKH